jgi:SAM-dependent methyltransferase
MRWYDNLRKIALGRQSWRPEDEYAYYEVNPKVVYEHAQRQILFARECYYSGLQIMRSMQILDTSLIQGKSILDLGAGEALLSQAILSCGAKRVIAVDAVPKQIWAAALLNRPNPGLECLIADATMLPYEKGSFDMIVGNLILHHIEPLAPLFQEVRRLLVSGGTIAFFEPSPLMGAFVHQATSANEAPVKPREIKKALVQAGFEGVSTQYWWNRLQTSKLGFASPGYVVSGRLPGMVDNATVRLSRPLIESGVPNLRIDSECSFKALVARQIEEIHGTWRNMEKPGDWKTRFAPW